MVGALRTQLERNPHPLTEAGRILAGNSHFFKTPSWEEVWTLKIVDVLLDLAVSTGPKAVGHSVPPSICSPKG